MKKTYYLFICLLLIPFSFAQSIGTGLGFHSIVTKADGTVYTWGYNVSGQLGNGTSGNNTDSNVPVAVDTSGALSGKTITSVATGYYHSVALASDGTVYTWGHNSSGQLGNGTSGGGSESNVPVAVNGVLSGKTITAVAAGSEHSVALASDGSVYTWGRNNYGQLGNGTSGDGADSNEPVAVNANGVLSGKTITAIAAGEYHSIALDNEGNVYTWGANWYGQLGNGDNDNSNEPVAVTGALTGKKIIAVAAGREHSIALVNEGNVYTWGENSFGQLGIADTGNSNVPLPVYTNGVLSGKTITAVAAGYWHSITLASDGTVYTWGHNSAGQLGNGSKTFYSNVPVAVYQEDMGLLPVEAASSVPTEFSLLQNYPNPFNPSTIINYQLPMNNFVTLKVYNMLGQEVATLVNEQKPAGNYEVKFDASNLASGVYLYKLQLGSYNKTMKMILMK